MNEYGVVIDINMVRNVIETDTRETGDLITFKLIAYVGLLGLLPAILFCAVPWTPRTFKDEAIAKLKCAGVAFVVLALAVLSGVGQFSVALSRPHRIQDDADALQLHFGAYTIREQARDSGRRSRGSCHMARMRIAKADSPHTRIAFCRRCRRDGALGSFCAQRLRKTDQSGAVQSQGSRQLSACVFLRNGYGAVGAVHVFRSRQSELHKRQGRVSAKPARYPEACRASTSSGGRTKRGARAFARAYRQKR